MDQNPAPAINFRQKLTFNIIAQNVKRHGHIIDL